MTRRWIGRLGSLVRRRTLDTDIGRELNAHLAMEMAHRQAAGMSADEARRTALRDFGGVQRVREEVRDERGMTFIDGLSQDARFAIRTLRRSPGFALVTIGILALGIGANTAIFSVVRGVLFKPLPFRAPSELALVQESAPGSRLAAVGVSIPELWDYRARLQSIHDLVEYHGMSFTLLNQGEPDRVNTGVVSANFFSVLGVTPVRGRDFVETDAVHGADAVLLLSYPYWQQKFGGDPGVVGKVVQMNDRPHTIVGVLPDFPQYPAQNDVYMPTSACPFRDKAEQNPNRTHRAFGGLTVFGRPAPGATVEQASAEIATVASSFTKDYPTAYQRAKGLTGQTVHLKDTLVQNARPMLLALSGTVILVLLIVCANVANLAIGRTNRRSREFAVRTALGAGRGRLLRQLLTESVIISLAGGALGLTLAWSSLQLLVRFIGQFTARTDGIAIDAGVLAFAGVMSVVTGLLFGIAPALAARRNPIQSMRGGASAGDTPRRHRVRGGLVIAQVAVSCVLLVGAGLLLKSFYRLSSVDLGFNADRVMTASFFGNFSTTNGAAGTRVDAAILDRLRSAPGVQFAAVTNSVPLSAITPGQATIHIEGRAESDTRVLEVDPNTASDGYFETLGIPVVAGRTFRPSDDDKAPMAVVINQSAAKYWDGASPIGSRFLVDGNPIPEQWFTVVGVVADFHLYRSDLAPAPEIYFTFRQNSGFGGRVLVRTVGNPADLIPVIKNSVHAVDPTSPVQQFQTLNDLHAGQLATSGVIAALLTVFAGVALLITLAGVAGIIATSVSQRTREFGLRMALGASRGSVLQIVLGQAAWLVAIGLALGLTGAWGFGRLLKDQLFATTATDTATYVVVAAAFLGAALIASFAPARRATSIDPLSALKTD